MRAKLEALIAHINHELSIPAFSLSFQELRNRLQEILDEDTAEKESVINDSFGDKIRDEIGIDDPDYRTWKRIVNSDERPESSG